MMTDKPSSESHTIIPKDTNRELILPAEMTNRGLELAKKIEKQHAIEKYNTPILKFPGLLNRSCITFSRNGEYAAITSHGKQKDNPGLMIWNMVNRMLSISPDVAFLEAGPPPYILERIPREARTTAIGEIKISTDLNSKLNVDPARKPLDIKCAALSKLGDIGLIGYADGRIGYCDIKDGVISAIRVIGKDPNGQGVGAIAISPDSYAMAISAGRTVRVWEAKSGREIQCLEGHNRFYNQLSFSDDGSKLLMANCNAKKDWTACLALLDIRGNSRPLAWCNDRTMDISAVAISPDNRWLATIDKNIVSVWDTSNGIELVHWQHTTYDVNDIIKSYSAHDSVEIPYSDEYDIEMRANQDPPLVLRNPYIWGLSSIAISADGTRILSGAETITCACGH
jgi:WD40 repeat protein